VGAYFREETRVVEVEQEKEEGRKGGREGHGRGWVSFFGFFARSCWRTILLKPFWLGPP